MSVYFSMDLCNSAEALRFMPTDLKFLLHFTLECPPALLSDLSLSFSFPSITISEPLSHNTQSNQPELSVCNYNMPVQTKGEKAFKADYIAFFIPVRDYLTIALSSCFITKKVPWRNQKYIFTFIDWLLKNVFHHWMRTFEVSDFLIGACPNRFKQTFENLISASCCIKSRR